MIYLRKFNENNSNEVIGLLKDLMLDISDEFGYLLKDIKYDMFNTMLEQGTYCVNEVDYKYDIGNFGLYEKYIQLVLRIPNNQNPESLLNPIGEIEKRLVFEDLEFRSNLSEDLEVSRKNGIHIIEQFAKKYPYLSHDMTTDGYKKFQLYFLEVFIE